MSTLREVIIVVSNIKTPDMYMARSYPHDDFDLNGKIELYKTPVYKVFINGTDESGHPVQKEWKALRFMPYWNNPKDPSLAYKTKGWVNSGLHSLPKKLVTYYNPNYSVHNTASPYDGAIQIVGSFLIHAGPEDLTRANWGWGAAGCVEIIGDFNQFKTDINKLAGSTETNAHDGILELVKSKKLYVQIDHATPPNIKSALIGEF